jgi:hypothetical protein
VGAPQTGIVEPGLTRSGGPLRRIAWIRAATSALAIVATAALLASGWVGEFGPVAYGAVLVVGIATSGAMLWLTLGLVRRDLSGVDRVLHDSAPVLQQVAAEVTEVLDLFEWPVFYVCSWPAGDWIFLSPAAPRLWGRASAFEFASRRAWIADIDPGDRERVARAWEDAGQGTFDVEYRIARATASCARRSWPRRGRVRWAPESTCTRATKRDGSFRSRSA